MIANSVVFLCLCVALGQGAAVPKNSYWLIVNTLPENVIQENPVPENSVLEIIVPENVVQETAVLENAVAVNVPENAVPEIVNTQSNPIPLNIPTQEGSDYNEFSTCFYANLKSSTPVAEQIPILSYFAEDAKTAQIILQLENERRMNGLNTDGDAYFQTAPSPDQWTHICFTWDGSSGLVDAFVDGVSIAGANNVQPGTQIPAQEGNWKVELPQPDAGQVTQLHFWDRVISPDEVQLALQCTLIGNILPLDPSILEQQGLANPSFTDGLPATCVPIQKDAELEQPAENAVPLNNPEPPEIPTEDVEYSQFSTCFYVNLKSATPVTEQVPILSYFAGDDKTAEIIFKLENERQMSGLYIGGGNGAYLPLVPSPDKWTHICLTWDGSSGLVNGFVDGEPIGAANEVQRGYQTPIQGNLNVELPQPDVGHLTQVHFWDRVISPDEVQQALQCTLTGNILAWDPYILGQQSVGIPSFSDGLPATCVPVQIAY